MEEPQDDAADRLPEEDEREFLQDIQRGLDDIEAGRVIPHEEVMARLLDRLEKDPRFLQRIERSRKSLGEGKVVKLEDIQD
ncbi:MAG: hypothetical protein ACJ76J_27700 [Thermoanaerobaculia bacterium]